MPKKQTRWSREWNEKNLDRLYITVPKGKKKLIEEYAAEHKEKINEFMNHLIRDALGISEEEWTKKPSKDVNNGT